MYNVFSDDRIKNTPLPLQSSMVNFSMYKELSCDVLFRSFSIKYVCEGTESYRVDGFDHVLNKGQYLLANHHSGGHVMIGSDQIVKGICIDVAPSILSEVALSKNIDLENGSYDTYFSTDGFPDSSNHINNTVLGPILKQIEQNILSNPTYKFSFDKSFFYLLAEAIVTDQKNSAHQIFSINSVKASTRKILFKKLYQAKSYIDNDFKIINSIDQIARESCLSEYHFLRLFKLLFKQSPYQYLLDRKLNYAHQLITIDNYNVTQVASMLHYQDVASFSKAFKKKYGCNPSQINGFSLKE